MNKTCLICGNDSFEWTDLHGEGICTQCGVPHQIIVRDENNKHLPDAPIKLNISDEWIPLIKRYWEETHKFMGFGTYLGYVKYAENRKAFYDWADKQPDLPKEEKWDE